jgi:hypothetical protein
MRPPCRIRALLLPWRCPAIGGFISLPSDGGRRHLSPAAPSQRGHDASTRCIRLPQHGTGKAVPNLAPSEADRRRVVLNLLKDELATQRIASTLVGRRRLVLRSDGHRRRYTELLGPADPQLYVFAAEAVAVVTTDGQRYRLADGRSQPAADPGQTAQIVAVLLGRRLSGK